MRACSGVAIADDAADFGTFAAQTTATPDDCVWSVSHCTTVAFRVSRCVSTGPRLLAEMRLEPSGPDDAALRVSVRDGDHHTVQWDSDAEVRAVSVTLGTHYALTLAVARDELARVPAAPPAPPDALFGRPTAANDARVLVDGLQTFERYYEALMYAAAMCVLTMRF